MRPHSPGLECAGLGPVGTILQLDIGPVHLVELLGEVDAECFLFSGLFHDMLHGERKERKGKTQGQEKKVMLVSCLANSHGILKSIQEILRRSISRVFSSRIENPRLVLPILILRYYLCFQTHSLSSTFMLFAVCVCMWRAVDSENFSYLS